jgi:hypothetical protein
MADATPMSLRIDSALKSAVDTTAKAQGMSTTEYIERALKTALHTTCTTCGRSSLPNATTPGFSPQFESWIAEQKRVAVNQPILVTTVEDGAQWVYWVKLRDATPMDSGVLMVKVFVDAAGTRGQDMAIPRGNIFGWREDGERRWYDNQLLLGFLDGNGRVVRRLIEVEQARRAARPVPASRGGRGRPG